MHDECIRWDNALLSLQKSIAENLDGFLDSGYQIKVNCHVRFVNLPSADPHFRAPFPSANHIGQFVEVKGNIVRMSQARLLELKREYVCSKCKDVILIEAEYMRMYAFEPPRHCSKHACKGTMYQKNIQPLQKFCIDYQELKLQELISEKCIPRSIIVTFENDLVDCCQPGDCVTIW